MSLRVKIETSFDGKRWTAQRISHISNPSQIKKLMKECRMGRYVRVVDQQTGYVIAKGMR
jgi:hypothetical protein